MQLFLIHAKYKICSTKMNANIKVLMRFNSSSARNYSDTTEENLLLQHSDVRRYRTVATMLEPQGYFQRLRCRMCIRLFSFSLVPAGSIELSFVCPA